MRSIGAIECVVVLALRCALLCCYTHSAAVTPHAVGAGGVFPPLFRTPSPACRCTCGTWWAAPRCWMARGCRMSASSRWVPGWLGSWGGNWVSTAGWLVAGCSRLLPRRLLPPARCTPHARCTAGAAIPPPPLRCPPGTVSVFPACLPACCPLCQVDYPERVGMLHRLLTPLSPRWDITLLHFRKTGNRSATALLGLRLPEGEVAEFRAAVGHLDEEVRRVGLGGAYPSPQLALLAAAAAAAATWACAGCWPPERACCTWGSHSLATNAPSPTARAHFCRCCFCCRRCSLCLRSLVGGSWKCSACSSDPKLSSSGSGGRPAREPPAPGIWDPRRRWPHPTPIGRALHEPACL